ncbi:MAG: ribonuclease H-like domain-containing protein [Deltaproteobacteria bacterium]|jgi:uncharacterized protein YprB with RNaseH-like and TPR domain|nr:ribonuclease H-like domain-containing protein [Deltaproteobacteria bacterium]
MSILDHTFIHIHGFKAAQRERELWAQGVMTHDDLLGAGPFPAAKNLPAWVTETKRAIAKKDHDFFATHLPEDQHYRVAMAYPSDTAFVDIETTGLSRHADDITVIGWSLAGKFKAIVHGRDDPGEFTRDLASSRAMVTFNGKSFDVPFLSKAFRALHFPKAHVDLRYLCKNVGLVGGQKSIEAQLGLSRQEGKGDGYMAVQLWHEYRNRRLTRSRRIEALKALILYNFADVNAMKLIFDACLDKLSASGHLPARYPNHFGPLAGRPDFREAFPCPLEPF